VEYGLLLAAVAALAAVVVFPLDLVGYGPSPAPATP